MVERMLEGKNIFVTGGSRDIGASIVSHLLESGANVGFCFHHPGQEKYIQEHPRLAYVLADLKSVEGREKIYDFILENLIIGSGRNLDGLILSASDDSTDLNVVANSALVNWLTEGQSIAEYYHEAGRVDVALMQSVPGHFYDRLAGRGKIPAFYNQIAFSKRKGESSISWIIEKYNRSTENKLNYFVVCPPAVEDTLNWIQFKKRRDPEIDIKHKKITDSLGLPEKVTKDEVGKKVAELLLNPPKWGYVEYFNGLLDGKFALSSIYGPSRRLIDTFNPETLEGYMIVTRNLCRDHFDILPGFFLEEAAAQYSVLVASKNHDEGDLPILDERSVKGLREMGKSVPGEVLKFSPIKFESPRKREFIAEVLVTNQETQKECSVFVKGVFYPRRFLKV